MKFSAALLFIVSALFFTACKKNYLKGYDTNELFTTPTETEKNAVLHDWQTRDLSITNYTILSEQQVGGALYTLKIVSYHVQGINEYGAILIPNQAGTFPVRMYIGGFGHQITTNSMIMNMDTTTPGTFIFAVPALRGQSLELTVNGVKYTTPISEGRHCDAFDGATDDALTLLNLVDTIEAKADVSRTSVRGGSRGGAVAMLAGIRDARVKRVVNVVGPTDILSLTKTHTTDPTYQCQFLDELVNEQTTVVTTRLKMTASSPYYFADRLPLTQLHMGINDVRIPVAQGQQLVKRMTELGTASKLEFYTYDRSHDDIAQGNPELSTRIEGFLSQL